MTDVSRDSLAGFPQALGDKVMQTLLQRAQPMLLRVDRQWNLIGTGGATDLYGAQGDGLPGLLEMLQNLLVGLSTAESHQLHFVELPNGCSVNLHFLHHQNGTDVVVLDAQAEQIRMRTEQQHSNEKSLVSHAKGKAIGELTRIRDELESQRAELERGNALKNALINTLSHDFRTPLTSIFGYLQLLEDDPGMPAHTATALAALRRNATYVHTLAENLLEYGRAESGALLLSPTPVELAEVAADMHAMFLPLAQSKSLGFSIDVAPGSNRVVCSDETRLRQIIVNLLSNAVRYTDHGEVGAELDARDGELRVQVRDTGIGIAEEFLGSVFSPFNQGGQSGSKGAGLGLSIVQRLVEEMGGELRLESEVDNGTLIEARLPQLDGDAAVPSVAPRPHAHGQRALVIDDDPDIAELLKLMLKDLGFVVRTSDDAAGELAGIIAAPPDLLLLDVRLPGLSGHAAAFKLRAQGYRGRIVMLSAYTTAQAREAALRSGADDFLGKPFNARQLASMALATTPDKG